MDKNLKTKKSKIFNLKNEDITNIFTNSYHFEMNKNEILLDIGDKLIEEDDVLCIDFTEKSDNNEKTFS